MKITFKYVGQGDSILLSWEGKGKQEIGIIDCNIDQGKNPLLDELKLMTHITAINFIFLSHPHYDHYSGLEELLLYCRDNGIVVLNIFHTCSSTPEFLQASVPSVSEERALASLWNTIFKLYPTTIQDVSVVNAGTGVVDINAQWKFQVIAPTFGEQQQFNKLITTNPDDAYKSNLLSTIVKIYDNKRHILLTSDAEHDTFKRLIMKGMHTYFKSSELVLGQVSHHGAKSNFHRKFWNNQQYAQRCPMAISVGPNGYKHPSSQVISELSNDNFEVHLTQKSATSKVSISLSAASLPVAFGNDLVYNF